MLREIQNSERPGEPGRRWFASEQFDLIVWLEGPTLVSFQLCYDKPREERAIVWKRNQGYSQFRVDTGEQTPTKNQSPVLLADGKFPKARVMAEFTSAAAELEPKLRDAIIKLLRECP